ncbi:phosphatase PAP2 family protein, partial [Streptomyces albidoflavus]
MDSIKRYRWGRRLPMAVASAGVGAAAVVWLAPGGVLGTNEPVHVTAGFSVRAYRALTGSVADGPPWAETVLEAASEGTLLFLGLLLAWVGWSALRRRDREGLAGMAVAAAGTVVAYGISEALKLLVDEQRPCRALPGVVALAPCPAPGDWSFPSNHATLAVALAVGVVLIRPRLAALALPVAGAAALLRVLVGVHYPHDVLAGAALGATAVVTVRLLVLPIALRAVSAFLVGQSVGRHRDHA